MLVTINLSSKLYESAYFVIQLKSHKVDQTQYAHPL